MIPFSRKNSQQILLIGSRNHLQSCLRSTCSIQFSCPHSQVAMSAYECIVKLGDKKLALEGLQSFESLFSKGDAKSKVALYQYVPKLMEACADKQKPVAQAAAALVNNKTGYLRSFSGQRQLRRVKRIRVGRDKSSLGKGGERRIRQPVVHINRASAHFLGFGSGRART